MPILHMIARNVHKHIEGYQIMYEVYCMLGLNFKSVKFVWFSLLHALAGLDNV